MVLFRRVAQERAEIVREAVGIDALALDQARIAEGGFLARACAVHQEHRAAALLQVNGDRHADDAGTENNHILAHGNPSPISVGSRHRESRSFMPLLRGRIFTPDRRTPSTHFL